MSLRVVREKSNPLSNPNRPLRLTKIVFGILCMVNLGLVANDISNKVVFNESNKEDSLPSSSNTNQVPMVLQAREAEKDIPSTFYTQIRKDRGGRQLLLMMKASLFAHQTGRTYGGACAKTEAEKVRVKDISKIVTSLGLQNHLKLACPTSENATFVRERHLTLLLNGFGETHVTLEKDWITSLRDNVTYKTLPRNTAVVHVRRGDVSPCSKDTYRYRPNSFYFDVIQHYIPKGWNVMILSEVRSYEPFQEFLGLKDYNVTLQLGEDLGETFSNMVSADMLVLSSSSFSIVAGFLSRGNVITTKEYGMIAQPKAISYGTLHWEGDQNWTPISYDIEARSIEKVQQIMSQCLFFENWLKRVDWKISRGDKGTILGLNTTHFDFDGRVLPVLHMLELPA